MNYITERNLVMLYLLIDKPLGLGVSKDLLLSEDIADLNEKFRLKKFASTNIIKMGI